MIKNTVILQPNIFKNFYFLLDEKNTKCDYILTNIKYRIILIILFFFYYYAVSLCNHNNTMYK